MAFGNRAEDSFIRLGQGREAPNRVTWGRHNRKALIRIPIVARDGRGRAVSPETVEFRLPDGSAHPHLLLAGVAQAMIAGRGAAVADVLARSAATESGAAAPLVPRSFVEVADCLRDQRAVFEAGGVFPSGMIDLVIGALSQRR